MSRPIDEKLVKFKIENADFKTKADETIGIFGRLKESLNKIPGVNLGKTVSDLGNIKNAASNVGLGGLAQSVENVSTKFSALDMITFSVLNNLTNRAVDAGFKIGKALAIDGATAGFKEYEQKMGAVQTMLAGAKNNKGMRVSIEEVNEQLEALNKYSDETIYSFSDMTTNISKFTNAGVSLEDSVAAIKGVANVAALSGANSNEASRAMYNFAQAIGTGSVKLIDWKSIENANMGTQEFKQQLLDAGVAAGTLKKSSDGMYKVLTKNNKGTLMPETISSTKGWSEALQYQWMTTEVLTSTLKDYSKEIKDQPEWIGTRASKAAKEVKTFTMLMDTTKESIQSGWSISSELIIGDFETAVKRWTAISEILGNIVGKGADSRNKTLFELKQAGVFENAWKSLVNVLGAFEKVTDIVRNAFKKIFPTDVKAIKNFSDVFLKFTEKLLSSEAITRKLTKAFEFLFKSFKFGIDIAVDVVTILWDLGKAMLGLIPDNLFKVVSAIFKNIFQLGGAFKTTIDPVNKIREGISKLAIKFEEFGEKLEPIVSMIGGALVKGIRELQAKLAEIDFGKISEKFKGFADKFKAIKFPDITPFIDKLKELINIDDFKLPNFSEIKLPEIKNPFRDAKDFVVVKKFVEIMERLREIGGKVKTTLQSIWDGIKNAASSISKTKQEFNDTITALKNGIGNIGLFEVAGVAGIGGGILMVQKVMSFVKSFKDLSKEPKKWREALEGFFGDIGGAIKTFEGQIKYKNLQKIAVSLLMIAGALFILSKLKTEQIVIGLGALGAALGGLMGSIKILEKVDFSKFESGKLIVMVTGLAIAVSIMSGAVVKLAKLPIEQLVAGSVAAVAILLILTKSMEMFAKTAEKSAKDQADMTKTVIAMGMIAIVVGILTKSIVKLSKIPTDQLAGSTIAVASLLAIMLGGFLAISALPMKGLDNIDKFVKFAGALGKSAVAIAVFSLSLKIMGEAVEFFGTMNIDSLKQGLLTIAAIMVALGVMQRIAGDKGSLSAGLGIAAVAISLGLLIPPLVILGKMPLDILLQGLASLAGILLGLSIAVRIAKDGFKGAAGIAILIVAINALVPAIFLLGNTDPKTLAIGILALAGALLPLVVAAKLAQGSIRGSVAITILAAAMNLLIAPIMALSSINSKGVESLLLGLGGTMLILAGATAYFGTNAANVMITAAAIAVLSGALTLLAVPIAAIGLLPIKAILTTLLALAGVLALLGGAAALLTPVIVPMGLLGGAVALLGLGALLGGKGLILLSAGIIAFSTAMGVAGAGIIMSIGIILDGLTKLMPKVEKFVSEIILTIAQVIIKNAPVAVLAVVVLMIALLDGIVQFLPKFIAAAILIMVALIDGIGKGLPALVQAAMQMMIDFVAGMRIAIKDQGPYLIREVLGLTGEILILVVQGIIAALDALIGGFPFVTDALKGLSNDVGTVLRDQFDGETLGLPVGESIPQGIATGIGNETSLIDEKISTLNQNTASGLRSLDTNAIGQGQAGGYGEGFLSKLPSMDGIGSSISETLGGGLGSFDFGAQGGLNVEEFDMGMKMETPNLEGTGLDISNLTGESMGSYDFLGAGKKATKVFGDGVESETQYARMKAAGVSDAAIKQMGLKVPDKEGKDATKAFADGMNSEKQYLIASARGISDETLAAMGLFPATEEGQKKAKEFGVGLNDEQKYLRGIAEGLSKDTLAALGLYPPTNVGKQKTKDLADGLTSEQKYAVAAATGVSEDVLAAMGLYPPTEEGKKKSKALGKGIAEEKQYAIGIAMGLSEEILAAMGLFDPEIKGRNKTKAVARGIIADEGAPIAAAKEVARETKKAFGIDTKPTGRDYDYGVRDGINDKSGVVVAAAKRMARETISGMRQTFEEKSPSKVGIRSGRFLAQGVMIGLDREAKRAKDAAARMAKGTLKSMNSFIDQFAPSFEKTNEMEVRIRPVMDMDRIPVIPDQKFKAKADLTNANISVNAIGSSLRQNGDILNQTIRIDELRKEWETLKASSAKPTADTYNINITANGDLPQAAIKRMAQQIQIEIKNVNDRDKMSKGGVVNY